MKKDKLKEQLLKNNYIRKIMNNGMAMKLIIISIILVLAYVSYTRIDKIKYYKTQIENQNEIIEICKEGKSKSVGATYFMSSYWENEIEEANKELKDMNIKLISNIVICGVSAVGSIFILIKSKNRLLKGVNNG